jgi:lysophospholipid acyltransferase (LPLAT)-like uncharacterized protein
MLKALGRSRAVRRGIGFLAVNYLRLVRSTTRFTVEPADLSARVTPELPLIAAMWHGQHFMIHFAWPRGSRFAALISRSADGAINADILERLGVLPIRGSGGSATKMRKRGGVAALREMLRGVSVALTADVPKVSRIAGPGIVTLAQMSGRPIYPVAVVSGRRLDFASWDRASLGLPFGRGAIVLGDPIHVARDADAATREAARLAVQAGLDRAHARAYALVGSSDPAASPPGDTP